MSTDDPADTRGRGFFRAPPPRISIVADHVRGASDVEELLRHELTHAVDVRTWGRVGALSHTRRCEPADPAPRASRAPRHRRRAQLLIHSMDLASCGGLACSEVRAASAAECASSSDAAPLWRKWRCVRAKARVSTAMVFSDVGHRCVDRVFDSCFGSALGSNPTAAGTPYAALLAEEARRLR